MKVLKFGGTSVADAKHIDNVAQLVSVGSKPILLVLSAMAGTTNSLVEISRLIAREERLAARTEVDMLYEKYAKEVLALFPGDLSRKTVMAAIETCFGLLREMCQKEGFTDKDEKKILAQGELMSTAMMHRHLIDMDIKAVQIPALDYMRIDEAAEPDLTYITEHLQRLLQRSPGDTEIYVTEGYICHNAAEEVDNLRRGGSDYTASLVGVAVKAEEIQIWTDIDGLHNNDPRIVEQTKPVRRLHFEEAAELAYFGAKILHPTCIQPAKEHNIPVRLLNTLDPSRPGTFISLETDKDKIKAVSAKDDVTLLKIQSNRSLPSYKFLSLVFDTFDKYATVVDMVTTSEVGVALTVNDDRHVEAIVNELNAIADITVERGLAIVCVVGDMESANIGYEAEVIEAIRDFPLRMISYGGSNYNVAVLISKDHKQPVLRSLSDRLFAKD